MEKTKVIKNKNGEANALKWGARKQITTSFLIKPKKGYDLNIKIRDYLKENNIKIDTTKWGRSYLYKFDGFCVKISNYQYDEGRVQITVFKKTEELTKILEKVIELSTDIYVESKYSEVSVKITDNFFIQKNARFISKVNKDMEEYYQLQDKDDFYNILVKKEYTARLKSQNDMELEFEDKLDISCKINKNTLNFLPILLGYFLEKVEKEKDSFRERIIKI